MSKKRDEKKLKKRKHARLHKEIDNWLVSLSISVDELERQMKELKNGTE